MCIENNIMHPRRSCSDLYRFQIIIYDEICPPQGITIIYYSFETTYFPIEVIRREIRSAFTGKINVDVEHESKYKLSPR